MAKKDKSKKTAAKAIKAEARAQKKAARLEKKKQRKIGQLDKQLRRLMKKYDKLGVKPNLLAAAKPEKAKK